MKDSKFIYYSFDVGPRIAIANTPSGLLHYESDWHFSEADEVLPWLQGIATGYQKAYNEIASRIGVEEKNFIVEENDIDDNLKALKSAKQEISLYGLWSQEMEEYLNATEKNRESEKDKALYELGENEGYWYCWGFSGVDYISEDSIKYDIEPDFIHKGTKQQAESMAFWQAVEDLQSYRGLHGVPDEEEMDEDGFLEYASDNVVTFVEEKFAFDKANKNKTWEMNI